MSARSAEHTEVPSASLIGRAKRPGTPGSSRVPGRYRPERISVPHQGRKKTPI